jgi:hypothetical protein
MKIYFRKTIRMKWITVTNLCTMPRGGDEFGDCDILSGDTFVMVEKLMLVFRCCIGRRPKIVLSW